MAPREIIDQTYDMYQMWPSIGRSALNSTTRPIFQLMSEKSDVPVNVSARNYGNLNNI